MRAPEPRAAARGSAARSAVAAGVSRAGASRSATVIAMSALPPTEYIAVAEHVREVVLAGSASPDFWRDHLRGEGLVPFVVDGRARILVSATELHFGGLHFREVTASVVISRDREGRTEDGAYLLIAFNSSRLLAFCERHFFLTPYVHATIDLEGPSPASLRVTEGECVVLEARSGYPMPSPNRATVERFAGPVFLPHAGRPREVFHARIEGLTRACPFDPALDAFAVRPTAAAPALASLVDSGFQPTEWLVRDDATHARSRTFERGDAWPELAA